MNITTPLSEQLGCYLDLATARLKATAGNMANVDTPGYKSVGFDFAAEMVKAAGLANEQSGSPRISRNTAQPRLTEVEGLLERPDGNNVSMDREGLQLAEAQLQFRTGIELIRREYTRVLDAIHADAK